MPGSERFNTTSNSIETVLRRGPRVDALDKKTVGRILGLLITTGLLAASIITMYVGLARFEPTWFWPSVAGYVVLLFLVLFLFRIRPDETDAARPAPTSAVAGKAGALSAASRPDAPIEVEKATGRLPLEAATLEPTAPGYSFRGYTLYESTVDGKTVRVFAKKVPIGATAISLPTGYEASWDAKKRQPKLIRIIDETPEVVVDRGAGRPCSAWTSPGEICNNVAATGSSYCKAHAKYRAGDEWGDVEARTARRGEKPGIFRSASPKMEVITSKPKAKPFTVRIPTVEIRLAKPSAKPVKLAKGPEPDVRTDRRAAGKPLRLGQPRFDVQAPTKKASKPLRIAEQKVNIRSTKPEAPRPFRVGQPDLRVRDARPKAGKPLRLKEPKVEVRQQRPTAGKPLRVKEPEVQIRSQASRAAKPLRVAEPKLEIKAGGARTAKPLRPAVPEIEVRVAKPTPKKPLDLGDMSNVEVVSGAAKKRPSPKELPPAGEILVVKDTRGRTDVGLPESARRKSR